MSVSLPRCHFEKARTVKLSGDVTTHSEVIAWFEMFSLIKLSFLL